MSTAAGPAVALVTCASQMADGRDRDLPELVRALGDAGAAARAVVWDDPAVDWAAYDLVVIRSTWDYTPRAAEYVAWAERVAAVTRLANPADVVRWNTDKRYLGELAAADVPTVPTTYLTPDHVELPAQRAEFVLKPTAGAGARLAARYRPDEHPAARAHLARLHADGLTAMLQPYAPHIDETGERALVFLGGRFLHAIQKGAVLAPGTAYDAEKVSHPGVRPWAPSEAELDVAARALAAIPGDPDLLYARVDLVDGADGQPRVMELELVEPNLFLWAHPGSAPVVAEAILKAALA
ncbi:ATP-grasp domain-containing protein [Streptomyces lasiicapitis]|uniref:ATP-grasp domain-containing protein n=2 Tax=Streptomyces lasiicapitis TaxID=1923961 RepID=A0ABQ2LX08_9ACTN|nr:ATP-grasp domain-containing protein [Streptomyces lasiicapitis]